MRTCVLDASALLALLNEEPGSEQVANAIMAGAVISAINFSEVVAKLSDVALPEEAIHEVLDILGLEVVDFAIHQAYQTGLLRPQTKHIGLSLGDRACIALAMALELPAITTDRIWKDIASNVVIQVIR